MQTIKTGIVVALLLAVCYGAFVALNAPEAELPDDIEQWAMGQDQLDQLGADMESNMFSLDSAVPMSPDEMMNDFGGTSAPPARNSSGTMSLASNTGAASGTPASVQQMTVPGLPFPNLPGASSGTNPSIGDAASAPRSDLTGSLADLPPGTFPDLSFDDEAAAFEATKRKSEVLVSQGVSAAKDAAQNALGTAPGPGQPASTGFPSLSEMDMFAGGNGGLGASPLLDFPDNEMTNATSGTGLQPTELTPPAATGASTGGPGNQASLPTADFATARQQALDLAAASKLKEALAMLTPYFSSPELGYEEHSDLVDIMDALSREVIYSQRHLLEPAYRVTERDRLETVAAQFGISPEFLAAINRMGGTTALVPGSELKVVRGPFRATVNLAREELTLFLGEYYAGRFPISVGKDPGLREGNFTVGDRQLDRTYYGGGGVILTAKDPRNPYGGYWLNLGQDICIHGTAEMTSDDLKDAGCISLAPLDAKDVYNILVVDSQVRIVK